MTTNLCTQAQENLVKIRENQRKQTMGSVQLKTGLISGMDLAGTVDSLIALESGTLKNLQSRNEKYLLQQTYFSQLTKLFMTANYMISNLSKISVFDRRDVTSSNESALGVARSGNPPAGTHTFTPVRTATSQQVLSSGVKSATEALGITGSVTMRYGRNLETNFDLSNLNGGEGFARGQIRITDKSGDKGVIDLRGATTMQDVLDAINNNTDISVRAEVDGDRLKLTDLTGQTDSNLAVQEVAGGSTAASLGLLGISTTDQTLTGSQIVKLGANLRLSALHDGNGFENNSFSSDLQVTLADGTTATIDFSKFTSATTKVDETTGETVIDTPAKHADELTIGDLIQTITQNESLKGKLEVSVSSDGHRLVWKDLTYNETDPSANTATFGVSTLNGSASLVSLGLAPDSTVAGVTSDNGTISGGRIIGSLGSVLLSSLDGGAGIDFSAPSGATELSINVQDLAGNSKLLEFTTNEVAAVETLDQYMTLINDKLASEGIGLTVQLNSAKTGLQVKDTSGGYGSSIVFQDSVGDLASKMGLTYTSSTNYNSYVSQDLNLQVVSGQTLLSDLNGGQGIDTLGSIKITDSDGKTGTVTMSDEIVTVGDLIRAISGNGGANVVAEINPAGDGIRIIDNAGGTGTMTISEGDSYSTMASDLHFLQTAEQKNIYGSGNIRYVIDGSMTYNVNITAEDTLTTITEKLNSTKMGIDVSIFNDGSTTPYRLMFGSSRTGEAAKFTVDLSALGMTQDVMSKAHDAVVAYGDINSSSSVMITSSSNIIRNVVPGINIEIKSSSMTPVTISTQTSSTEIKASLTSYVENINAFLEVYQEATYSDPESNEYGALFTDSTARSLYSDLTTMLTGTFNTTKGVQSLMQLGIKINAETRMLEFDAEVFDEVYKTNEAGIREFFIMSTVTDIDKDGKEVTTQVGFAAKYTAMAERYTGASKTDADGKLTYSDGTLGNKYAALDQKIQKGYDREEYLQARLDSKRIRLYKNFIRMETALASMQKQISALGALGTSEST